MFDYDRLEELIKEKGITQKFIADKLGRKPSIFQAWRNGKSMPNVDQIKLVAEILQTTPQYLLHQTDEKNPTTQGDGVSENDELLEYIINSVKQFPIDYKIRAANDIRSLMQELLTQDK